MAPEQVLGLEMDERADVYSLGVVLYELLTLRSPYTATELTRLLLQVAEGEVIPAREAAPNLSHSLAAILGCAMARDPQARYASVRALIEDIEAVLDGLTPRAEQASMHRRVHRYVFSENNPHASLRLADLDMMAAAGLSCGLLIATFVGGWFVSLGGWASAGLAIALVGFGSRPVSVLFKAARAGGRISWGRS